MPRVARRGSDAVGPWTAASVNAMQIGIETVT
jgi:hypothetical protein